MVDAHQNELTKLARDVELELSSTPAQILVDGQLVPNPEHQSLLVTLQDVKESLAAML